MKAARAARDMVSMLECDLATLEMGRGENRTLIQHEPHHHFNQSLGAPWRAQEGPLLQLSPQNEPMPMEPEHHTTARSFKPSLAGCALHIVFQLLAPSIILRLNGIPVPTLLDSWGAITLACPSALTQTLWKPGCHLCACRCERSPHCIGPDRRPKR